MEDHLILGIVASWPGRGPAQTGIETRGFALHNSWQKRCIHFCGEERSPLLNRYWDDLAFESMQTLGQSVPDQRAFVVQPKHRSSFLDELFEARDFLEPDFPSPPLIKCLFEREKKVLLDQKFREGEAAFFKNFQKLESLRLGIRTSEWSGRKRDAIPFADEICKALAFERYRNRWRKQSVGGLVFEVSVDLGGSSFSATPPLVFRILHIDDPKLAFELNGALGLDRLVPGFFLYGACSSASDYVLGIRAQIELFDVIAETFNRT
jgi:hypothetical protein